ncbi:MAG: flavodoxin [Lachnospiraceae bacterium]
MKKIISLIMIITLCTAVLTACGNRNEQQQVSVNQQEQVNTDGSNQISETASETELVAGDTQEASETVTEQQEIVQNTTEQTEATDNDDEPTGKVLVVYYSATGNTKAVAEVIADYTNGDTFELIPVDDYTDEDLDWTKDGSRVNREHEDESLQDIELVSTTVENFDSYDTVFIGYPIWWHEAAWPVNNFVKNNDFSGKTVIPFCTSSSSKLGESGTNLAAMAGTGDWQEGQRFSGSVGEDEVREWLEGLDF